MEPRAPLLDVSGLTVRFGGIVALDQVSFQVPEGVICGLIGPNGAGKTTLFNCLSRLYAWSAGSIRLAGRDIGLLPRHRMMHLGLGRTFQNLALFGSMTVLQNVMLGMHSRLRSGYLPHFLKLQSMRREEAWVRSRAGEIVELLGLGPVAQRQAADLPFGTQKRVELGRALAGDPKLLLLDEPAAGLNHEEVDQLAGLIRDLRSRLGLTVLLVEHHMNLVMNVSDTVVALDFGRKIADGTPEAVRHHPDVVRAYLGEPA